MDNAALAMKPLANRLKRFGVAGFLFFLAKGLFWLSLPVVAYLSQP
jgi:hypothetical protein